MRVEGICGSFTRTVPTLLPVVQSTWAAWKALHPETTVVSFDQGFSHNYNRYLYGSYARVGDTSFLFPQSFVDPRRPAKELVLGIRQGAAARAWAYGALGERTAVNDVVGDRSVVVVYDAEAKMAVAFSRDIAGSRLTFEVVEDRGFPFRLRDVETGPSGTSRETQSRARASGPGSSRSRPSRRCGSPGPPSTATPELFAP